MDRNTIIGLGIIGLLLVGYSIFTKPQREAQLAERSRLDSITRVEQIRAMETARQAETHVITDETGENTTRDAESMERLSGELGDFANAATGTTEIVVLENEQVKLSFSTLGGRPYTVQLKQYQTHDSLPLIMMDGDSTIFALQFFAENRSINTGDLYFQPAVEKLTGEDGRSYQQLTMKMDISETASISYIYRLFDEDYMLDFDMRFKGLDQYRTDRMEFKFDYYAPSQ